MLRSSLRRDRKDVDVSLRVTAERVAPARKSVTGFADVVGFSLLFVATGFLLALQIDLRVLGWSHLMLAAFIAAVALLTAAPMRALRAAGEILTAGIVASDKSWREEPLRFFLKLCLFASAVWHAYRGLTGDFRASASAMRLARPRTTVVRRAAAAIVTAAIVTGGAVAAVGGTAADGGLAEAAAPPMRRHNSAPTRIVQLEHIVPPSYTPALRVEFLQPHRLPTRLRFPMLRLKTTGAKASKADLASLALMQRALEMEAPLVALLDLRDTGCCPTMNEPRFQPPPLSLVWQVLRWASAHSTLWDTHGQAIAVILGPKSAAKPLLQLGLRVIKPQQPMLICDEEDEALAFLAKHRVARAHKKRK